MLDTADLKRSIDLREIVRQHWGRPVRCTPSYDVHQSMWRDDGRRASFTVYEDRFKDYGGDGASGDLFTFLEREHQLTFIEALRWAADYRGISAPKIGQSRRSLGLNSYAQKSPLLDAAPDQTWQEAATSALHTAQAYLWSGQPDAERVLNYLRHERGLSDASIRAAGYGYAPCWQRLSLLRPDTNKPLAMPPGIVEPWFYRDALWSLRVRCRVGSLAEALGIADDTLRGEPAPKYLNLAGSLQRGALYNGDAIERGCIVLLVEGGFDAMLAGQILDPPSNTVDTVWARTISPDDDHLPDDCDAIDHANAGDIYATPTGDPSDKIVVVTLGAATNHPTDAVLTKLRLAKRVLLLLDADDAGQTAQSKLRQALGEKASALELPDGQDVTDFVQAGGDLAALVGQALYPAWWRAGVPDSVRSALLRYCPGAVALAVELLNQAVNERLLNPDCFTIADLLRVNETLGFEVNERTLRRAFKAMTGYFWVESDAQIPSSGRGRPAQAYALVTRVQFNEALVAWATPRIIEAGHPTDGDQAILARPTPAMLEALGYDAQAAVELSSALLRVFARAFAAQDFRELETNRYALRQISQLAAALNEQHSTRLPAGWNLDTVSSYRAALLRGSNDPEQRRSRREIANLLGASNGSIGVYLQQAGLERRHEAGEFEEGEITADDVLEKRVTQLGYRFKGYPKRLCFYTLDGVLLHEVDYRSEASRQQVAYHRQRGHRVTVKFQVANHYVPVTETQPERPQRAQSGGGGTGSSRPRVFGPQHDPNWVREQLLLGLERLGQLRRHGSGWLDPTTGECYDADCDAYTLLDMLLPQQHKTIARGHPLVRAALALGGVLEAAL